jgi:hypothetical protein
MTRWDSGGLERGEERWVRGRGEIEERIAERKGDRKGWEVDGREEIEQG